MSTFRRLMRCAAVGLVLVATGGAPAAAQESPADAAALPDSVVEARTREIASQLRCVVCQGLSVEDSPSELAQEMKNLVREQVREGKSEEQIKAYFVGRYGEFVLLRPEPRGFNLLVYLLPLAALLGGGFILFRAVRGWTREPPADGEEPPAADENETRAREAVR